LHYYSGLYRFCELKQEFARLLDALRDIEAEALETIKEAGQRIRTYLENLDIPSPISQEIIQAWQKTGSQHAYAVRSSATAEDLPGASFAGQQDTYLNIKGESELLAHVRKCWASLFTDRAIAYRAKNGFDHRKVLLSVVVQQMVFPEVSGIMFTADPVTGNRKVISIDAAFGLGEALVSRLVNADLYKVRNERIVKKQVAVKKLAIYPLADGGTEARDILSQEQSKQALPDEAILALAQVGRRIEEHFGRPQDIEWGYADGRIYIVQSRPITTLYPLPELPDATSGVYVSFGHVGTEDANALLSNLRGSAELASLGPVVGISKIIKGEMSREKYLQRRIPPRMQNGWRNRLRNLSKRIPTWKDYCGGSMRNMKMPGSAFRFASPAR
jgi:phosphoenolpyruvate synthase/pyruvate phosphate dikinase